MSSFTRGPSGVTVPDSCATRFESSDPFPGFCCRFPAGVGVGVARERYGLVNLASDFQETAGNHTRFLVVLHRGRALSDELIVGREARPAVSLTPGQAVEALLARFGRPRVGVKSHSTVYGHHMTATLLRSRLIGLRLSGAGILVLVLIGLSELGRRGVPMY